MSATGDAIVVRSSVVTPSDLVYAATNCLPTRRRKGDQRVNEIVVGVYQSDTARKAATTAAEIASDGRNTLHIVMCVSRSAENISVGGDSWHEDSVASAEQFISSLELGLSPPDVTHAISFDDPAKTLCAEAERLGARMIVVGNHRVQGATRVLGSVAIDVVRHAPCDVLVANTTGD